MRRRPFPAALHLALTLLSLAPMGPAHAQQASTPAAEAERSADRVFASVSSTSGPGCAVGIARAGQVLLTKGYGMADLAAGRAIGAETVLESGSVAKQFMATAILLLAKDGKLSLDDDVRRFVPELPDYGRVITVRHLLNHTSGLREWSDLVALQGWPRGTRVHTQDYAVRLIAAQRALNYPVGDHYSYTNSGYLLAREVVERVSGLSFMEFTRQRIFAPLGMTRTQWRDDFTRVVPALAQAYGRRADGWHLDMPGDNVIGAGGMLTTVGDWLRWNDALDREALGADVTGRLTEQGRLTNGITISYALGQVVGRYRGTREIAHSGSTAGYSTYLARYPELDRLSIAVLCNFAGAPAAPFTRQLVDALAPGLATVTPPDTAGGGAAAGDLSRYAGVYRNTQTSAFVVLTLTDGRLTTDAGTALRPLSDGTFALGNNRVRFGRSPDGTVRELLAPTGDGDTVRSPRVATTPWQPAREALAPFVGRYSADEVGKALEVRAASGDVPALEVFTRPGVSLGRWTPVAADAFRSGSESLWFTRDRRGRITALHLGSGRVWDFAARRLP